MAECESDSDSDLVEGLWSLRKRKKIKLDSNKDLDKVADMDNKKNKLSEQFKKFEELKKKSSEIMVGSAIRRYKTEVKRSQRLLRKALKDPCIKAALKDPVSENEKDESNKTTWEDVKPYLSVNEHLQGPIPHGDCGPKTELEYKIEDCIKEGDFEKAELLSDTLANREFAVKIAHAFAAKKFKETDDKQKADQKRERMKKIRWMFDAKEKWQMKGNM